MAATIIISVITILLMILAIIFKPNFTIKKISFQTFYFITTIGALILIIFNLIPINKILNSFTSNTSVNPIKILLLFISISFLSISLDELGFFSYIAIKASRLAKKNQYSLFFILYILITILTIFTSNDIIILTFTPFICQFSKRAKISPLPYLIMEFITANTYSMLLPIGNPTNIYLTSYFNISFLVYIKSMILPTLFSGLSSLLIILLIFHKKLSESCSLEYSEARPLKDKKLIIINIGILAICTILLAISNYINLEMWLISLICFILLAIILIIYSIIEKTKLYIIRPIKRLPYSLIPFLISMFIIVLSLDHQGIISYLAAKLDILCVNKYSTSFTYLLSSTVADNIINNIPMTVFFSTLINSSNNMFLYESVYTTIIGSNIGAYLTPIGALAGIMWMSILKAEGIDFKFCDFIKYGIIIVPIVLIFAYLGLILIF